MGRKIMLKAAVAVVVVATFSNAAWAQSEGDRIKALEEMIQKQQAQIEAQQKVLEEMRAALKTVQESD